MMMWRGMRGDARLYLLRALSGRTGGVGKPAARTDGSETAAPAKPKPASGAKKGAAR